MMHISKNENRLREKISEIGRSFHRLGMAPGTSGNISALCKDGWLMTPTNVSLGDIDPSSISKLSWQGKLLAGDNPTKESFLHRAFYDSRPNTGAVIHLHSSYATAVSCLAGLDADSCIPPITPYFVMRVGKLPLVPYYQPGDPDLGKVVRNYAARHKAVLLANHGPVVSGPSLDAARNSIEELEETARLLLMLAPHEINILKDSQISGLRTHFNADW